ncbi:pale cress protein (PAC) [Rhynchospora pubera]|uniref:Pale cress protein (PAC) n=1 Tax=Rhynchospora pubera TaxID=906938 RepID=A0AAV8EY32_9POAL|nr:pale cress protein (PAC) [Rhynchospora pubera]
MAFVGYATPGFLPFRTFSTKSDATLRQLQDRCSIISMHLHWRVRTGALKEMNEEQTVQEDESAASMNEIDDEDWQAQAREKTRQWHAYRKKEEEEEERRTNEYREIGMRMKEYPDEDVRKARMLVSDFICAGEEVEEKIEVAAEKGQLNELVLMVIWNRLDIARRDEETDVIRSLDLLYRRIETEILKRESTPSMQLLNELLNLHDGYDDDGWKKKCRNLMLQTFAREDSFGIIAPGVVNSENLPPEDKDALLRIDFIREVDDLLKEVRSEQDEVKSEQGFDPESVAARLKQQEKQHTIYQIETLLEQAVSLKW